MTTESIFNDTDNDFFNDEDIEDNIPLDALVGEGKKYKTPDDIAKAIIHKDRHIANLEREARELREKSGTSRTVEEILSALKNNKTDTPVEKPLNANDGADPALRPEDLVSKVVQELENRKAIEAAKSNMKQVQDKLVELYGRGYSTKLAEMAEEKGIPRETLEELAQKSPKGFFNILGVDPTKGKPTLFGDAPRGSVDPFRTNKPVHSGVRDKAYYDDLRKRDPKTYWNAATQARMHLDLYASHGQRN